MMFWLILVSVVLGLVAWILLSEEDNPLDQLPGPVKRPIIGNAMEFIWLDSRKLFITIREFFVKFGDRFVIKVFRRRILHIQTPNDFEVVLSHSKNITKSMPYTFLQPWLGTGLLLSTGSKWHKRRKILTPTFHFNILKNFSIIMEEKSRGFVEKMRKSAGTDIDIMAEVSDFTLCTICETAMGTQLDKDKSAKTVEYKTAIQTIGQMMMYRVIKVWLRSDLIFSLSEHGKRYKDCLAKVHDFANNVIEERQKQRGSNTKEFSAVLEGAMGSKRRLAMLDLLLEAQDNGEIDLEGIREEVNTFMFEGYDTTAMALTFALMLLADHKEVQDRIYEECVQIVGPSDRTPTAADWAEMKYLDAVIKETLRLYPSVPFIARTITEDFMLDDLLVKKGSEVAVHIYDLHRRPDLYPDPDSFLPERFLSGESRHPYAYVPFSAGPRNCIGQKFAVMEMKCLLSSVCRAFQLQAHQRGARPDLFSDLVLRPTEPLYVKFLPR